MNLSRLRLGLLMLLFFHFCRTVSAQATVTYLANEGFLVEGGGRKALVDALFGQGLDGYPAVPAGLRSKLEAALPPFDGVDLVLATHHHGDHFDAQAVARHLRANPRAHFLSTPQAAEQVKAIFEDDPQTLSRIEAAYPDEGRIEKLVRGGVQVEVLNLHHGRNRRPPVQNLGFLISLGGLQILHIGDTEATVRDFQPFNLQSRKIDLALVPVWYLTYDSWIEAVRREIRPVRIGGMHLAEPDAPASFFGPDGSYARRVDAIRANFPEAVLFMQPGSARQYP